MTVLATDWAVAGPRASRAGESSTTERVTSRFRGFRFSRRGNVNTQSPADIEAVETSRTSRQLSWESNPARANEPGQPVSPTTDAADDLEIAVPLETVELQADQSLPSEAADQVIESAPEESTPTEAIDLSPPSPADADDADELVSPLAGGDSDGMVLDPSTSAEVDTADEPVVGTEPLTTSSEPGAEAPVPMKSLEIQIEPFAVDDEVGPVPQFTTEEPDESMATPMLEFVPPLSTSDDDNDQTTEDEDVFAASFDAAAKAPRSPGVPEQRSGLYFREVPVRSPVHLVLTPVAPAPQREEILVGERSIPPFALVYSTRPIFRRQPAVKTRIWIAPGGKGAPSPETVSVDSVPGGPTAVSVEPLDAKPELTNVRAYSVVLPGDLR